MRKIVNIGSSLTLVYIVTVLDAVKISDSKEVMKTLIVIPML